MATVHDTLTCLIVPLDTVVPQKKLAELEAGNTVLYVLGLVPSVADRSNVGQLFGWRWLLNRF